MTEKRANQIGTLNKFWFNILFSIIGILILMLVNDIRTGIKENTKRGFENAYRIENHEIRIRGVEEKVSNKQIINKGGF